MATKNDKTEAIERTSKLHGDSYQYQLRKGSRPDLTRLKTNQRVCSAGISGYHVLMTEK